MGSCDEFASAQRRRGDWDLIPAPPFLSSSASDALGKPLDEGFMQLRFNSAFYALGRQITSNAAGRREQRCAFCTPLNRNPRNELFGAGAGISIIRAEASLVSPRRSPKVTVKRSLRPEELLPAVIVCHVLREYV